MGIFQVHIITVFGVTRITVRIGMENVEKIIVLIISLVNKFNNFLFNVTKVGDTDQSDSVQHWCFKEARRQGGRDNR